MKIRIAILSVCVVAMASAQIAIRGETVYTMAGAPISDGVVLVNNGKIERVGPAAQVTIPAGYKTLTAKVVTPGLIDAHTVIGLSGYLNQPQDQDQLERSAPIQPELRAIDAYDPKERLIEYVRGYGITTIHTGHGPGELISGQTMIVKLHGDTVDKDVIVPVAMVVATLGEGARATEPGKSPGTRSKAIAMLRSEFIRAQEYAKKAEKPEAGKEQPRDIHLEILARVVKGELPFLVTVHKGDDIINTIRLAKEFHLKLVLDGVAEAPLVMDEIKASGYPVIVHPTMFHTYGDAAELNFETASKLRAAGISFALQSGYEAYVPKTRVVLFEAAAAAANGLSFDQALASITSDAAKLLGIDKRVGTLEAGKDGDIAMYDGDPFEYTSHCIGVVIDGKIVSSEKR